MEVEFADNPCGGKGRMKLEKLLASAEMKDKCGLYARVTLPPGAVRGSAADITSGSIPRSEEAN